MDGVQKIKKKNGIQINVSLIYTSTHTHTNTWPGTAICMYNVHAIPYHMPTYNAKLVS